MVLLLYYLACAFLPAMRINAKQHSLIMIAARFLQNTVVSYGHRTLLCYFVRREPMKELGFKKYVVGASYL